MLLPWNKSVQVHVGDAALDAVVPGLMSELSSTVGPKVALHLILADSHFHFDLVSGDYRSASDRHLESIASACVTDILGNDGVDRLVRWQLQNDRRHLLICALANKDIILLDDAASHHSLCLHSLQSEFCTQWNAHAGALPNETSIFAVASTNHVVVVLTHCGNITALSCGTYADNNALDDRVDRLLSGGGIEPSSPSTFMLVLEDSIGARASQRWAVVGAARGRT